MAKIVKNGYKFAPVLCRYCGCEYEYEQGDDVGIVEANGFILHRKLRCPYCQEANDLQIEIPKE